MIPTLIEAAARSLLVAITVWAGLGVFRVRNVLAQKAAWGLVLAAAVVMPLLMPVAARWQSLPSAKIFLPVSSMSTAGDFQPAAQSAPPQAEGLRQLPSARVQADSTPVESAAMPQIVSTPPDRFPAPAVAYSDSAAPTPSVGSQPIVRRQSVSLASLAWGLYLAVAAALLIRLFYGLAAALRLSRAALPVSIDNASPLVAGLDLRASPTVASPVTIGSSIVIPANYVNWNSEKLRIVLAHERSHIRQGDFYLQILAGLYAALVWFSPLGWWLKRKLSELAEAISDRAGLEEAASRSSYAQILLEFAAAPRPTLIGVAMARSGSLSRRIERLLNEHSFHQAFTSNRRRILVAVLLVPVALFAATTLIRVRAATQAPQDPAPAAQAAPATQPAPVVTPAEPTTGVSNPDQSPIEATGQAEPAPAAPAIPLPAGTPSAPAPPIVLSPVAPMAPGPDMLYIVPKIAPLAPLPLYPELHVVVPNIAPISIEPPMPPVVIGMGVRPGIMFGLSQDKEFFHGAGPGNFYFYLSNGDSYALIKSNGQDVQFHGDWMKGHREDIEKARKLAHGNFLWFTRNGKSYFIDDPAIVAQVEAMNQPMEALNQQQEALGRQQDALGREQQKLGQLQQQASIPAPDLSREMAVVSEAVAKLEAKKGSMVTEEQLAEVQARIGELEGKLGALQGALQGEMAARQGALGSQEAALGSQEGKLGAEEGRIGAEEAKIAAETDSKIKSIIDESLSNGKAKPIQ